jgi:hypothetical protein
VLSGGAHTPKLNKRRQKSIMEPVVEEPSLSEIAGRHNLNLDGSMSDMGPGMRNDSGGTEIPGTNGHSPYMNVD